MVLVDKHDVVESRNGPVATGLRHFIEMDRVIAAQSRKVVPESVLLEEARVDGIDQLNGIVPGVRYGRRRIYASACCAGSGVLGRSGCSLMPVGLSDCLQLARAVVLNAHLCNGDWRACHWLCVAGVCIVGIWQRNSKPLV